MLVNKERMLQKMEEFNLDVDHCLPPGKRKLPG